MMELKSLRLSEIWELMKDELLLRQLCRFGSL